MRLTVKQLRRVIRESILKEYSILDGPYEPHVNQKHHAKAMQDLRRDALEFANTAGPASVLAGSMQYSHPEFVSMCQEMGVTDDDEQLFADCAVEYCNDMSEKQINQFVAAMYR